MTLPTIKWVEITELRSTERKKKAKRVPEVQGFYRYTQNPDRFTFTLKKKFFELGVASPNDHVRIFFNKLADGNLQVKLVTEKKVGDNRATGLFKVKEQSDCYRIMGGLPKLLPAVKGKRYPITFISLSKEKPSDEYKSLIFSVQTKGVK